MEQENIIRELELALEHLMLQYDRRLTLQQKEHEQKIQLILLHCKGIGSCVWIDKVGNRSHTTGQDLY